ncbi:hypothetical protein DFP97_108276 [Paenibacillus prosopidis]|uniref:Uncharacterized protein n=1 Tax=Paenibacillus prosopidis TaxID=630520 RepID=A0A368W028_9BACL|nr:hypothetical protein DFP97_108276 [Paenibacillus prosopidis]
MTAESPLLHNRGGFLFYDKMDEKTSKEAQGTPWASDVYEKRLTGAARKLLFSNLDKLFRDVTT